MADTLVLETLAEKLPPDLRDRLRSLAIQLQNLPPDDGLKLAVEALGFTSLVLKEVPAEVASVVDGIPAGLSDAQREAIKEDMTEVVRHTITTPSFKDLRETIGMIQIHQRKVRNETEGIMRLLGRTQRSLQRRNSSLPSLILGLAAGLASGLLAVLLLSPMAGSKNRGLATGATHGLVDYIEAELPEYGGKVGLVVVGNGSDNGEVLTAFKEDRRGVVVIRPPTGEP